MKQIDQHMPVKKQKPSARIFSLQAGIFTDFTRSSRFAQSAFFVFRAPEEKKNHLPSDLPIESGAIYLSRSNEKNEPAKPNRKNQTRLK